jgi:hypothetical protein
MAKAPAVGVLIGEDFRSSGTSFLFGYGIRI